jgi:hypothetical protein
MMSSTTAPRFLSDTSDSVRIDVFNLAGSKIRSNTHRIEVHVRSIPYHFSCNIVVYMNDRHEFVDPSFVDAHAS